MFSKLLALFFTLFLLLLPSSHASSQCTQSTTIYRFKLGHINATVIYDGPTTFDQNPFLVPDEQVQQSYIDCFRPTNPFLVSQNVIVFDTPNARVIVDPGARGAQNFPFFVRSGLLFDGLAEAGISPESIDAVLITHAHPDHVSGLINSDGTAAFPNADVFISKREHDFWTADPFQIPPEAPLPDTLNTFAQVYSAAVAPYSQRLRLVRARKSPIRGFRFLPTPGHSPGHSAIQVTSGVNRLVIVGDAWISKPDQLQNPDWSVGTESMPTDAATTRVRLLNLVASRRDLVMAFHEQFPGLGYVSKNKSQFDWIPAPLRLSRD